MIDQNKGKEKKKWYDPLIEEYQKKQTKDKVIRKSKKPHKEVSLNE